MVWGEKSTEGTKGEVTHDTENTWMDGHHREIIWVQYKNFPPTLPKIENSFIGTSP